MSRGSIAKIVRSYGSEWGRIRPRDGARELFFNLASMKDPDAFYSLQVGEYVDFDEENDRANGTRAVRVALTGRSAAKKA
jgi:cold shock CspA family protein